MNKSHRGNFDYEQQCYLRSFDTDNIVENLERFLRERGVDPFAAKERERKQIFKIKDIKLNLWKKAGFKKPVDWWTAASVLERRKWIGKFFEIGFGKYRIMFWKKPHYSEFEQNLRAGKINMNGVRDENYSIHGRKRKEIDMRGDQPDHERSSNNG